MKTTIFTFLILLLTHSSVAATRVVAAHTKLGENRVNLTPESTHCKLAQLKAVKQDKSLVEQGSTAVIGR